RELALGKYTTNRMRSKVSYCFRRCSCYRHSPPNAGYEVRVAYSAQPLWKRKSNISQTSRCWIFDCREQTGAAPARISRAQENAVDYHDRAYDEVRPPTVARSGLRTSPSQAPPEKPRSQALRRNENKSSEQQNKVEKACLRFIISLTFEHSDPPEQRQDQHD